MLTLAKAPRLSLAKTALPIQHVTLAQVYRSLVKQTNTQTAIAAGFIAAAVDLSHDCSMDADHSLVDASTRKMVDSFASEFYLANYHALMSHYDSGLYFYHGWAGVGSDLFCTLAGHGCGFWEHETGKPLDVWCKQWHCEAYAYGLDFDGEDLLGYDLETVRGYEIMLSRYH